MKKTIRSMLVALLSVAALSAGGASAMVTTDYSGQWWNETQSGWGAAVLHQANTLFINLMVYGSDGTPTWFTGAANLQPNAASGHTIFAGDLFATTGPYFGGSFNSSHVALRKVGSVTFDATSWDNATLSYVVNGAPVSTNVTRQTWGNDNLTGQYAGASHDESCGGSGHSFIDLTITHNADNSIVIRSEDADPLGGYLLMFGRYIPCGHMGQIVTELQAGDHGTMTFYEVERNGAGLVARYSGTVNGCHVDGRLAAVMK